MALEERMVGTCSECGILKAKIVQLHAINAALADKAEEAIEIAEELLGTAIDLAKMLTKYISCEEMETILERLEAKRGKL